MSYIAVGADAPRGTVSASATAINNTPEAIAARSATNELARAAALVKSIPTTDGAALLAARQAYAVALSRKVAADTALAAPVRIDPTALITPPKAAGFSLASPIVLVGIGLAAFLLLRRRK